MNNWLTIEFNDSNAAFKFTLELNKIVLRNQDGIYYKIFTPKNKELKNKVFYIADEGSSVVESLKAQFKMKECSAPERKSLVKVAGFSADREWMLQ